MTGRRFASALAAFALVAAGMTGCSRSSGDSRNGSGGARTGTNAASVRAGAAVAPLPLTAASAERQFLVALNTRRQRLGLAPLASDPRMVTVARTWAAAMADAGHISHNPELGGHMPDDWRKYGENVGVGETVASLHEAFLASPHHYVNIVDHDFNAVGVGVTLQAGAIWVVFDFLQSPSAPAATPVTTTREQ